MRLNQIEIALTRRHFFSEYDNGLPSNQRMVEMMQTMDASVSSSRGADGAISVRA